MIHRDSERGGERYTCVLDVEDDRNCVEGWKSWTDEVWIESQGSRNTGKAPKLRSERGTQGPSDEWDGKQN